MKVIYHINGVTTRREVKVYRLDLIVRPYIANTGMRLRLISGNVFTILPSSSAA
jgi:hypothetical protein